MEAIRSELLAIWSILLIAVLLAVVLLVRPVRKCVDCVPVASCIVWGAQAVWDILEALFYRLLSETLCYVYNSSKTAVQSLAKEWYPMAALTIAPIFWSVPSDGAVIYLVIYCAAGMLVCSVGPKKKEEIKTETKMESEFFMGMKIKIDVD
jgi:hypothetical protein